MTASPAAAANPELRHELHDIQGNLIGFNKDHQRLLFINFTDQATGRAFIAELAPSLTTGWEVLRFNALYKEISTRLKRRPDRILESTWTNIAFSQPGLLALGADGIESFPEEFRQGMAARAAVIGDVDLSAPANWTPPFSAGAQVHACLILAADSPDDLDGVTTQMRTLMHAHNVTEAGGQDGNVRTGDQRGHEHFGFKDGISQPGIAGLTRSSKHGQDTIAAGEFLIGYPDQDGHVSGQPIPAVRPVQPGYNPIQPPLPAALPPWTHNGSFLVYRRLRQDVAAFRAFVQDHAIPLNLPGTAVAAKLVGRWASGAPLERIHGERTERDPAAGDPGPPGSLLLSDERVNNFDYEPQDTDGHLVPRAAHIRKTNPRNAQPPGKDESNRHRILRRGIPYGPEFQETEPAYPGSGSVPDTQDRGLLFICYQASIADAFEFIQSQWANTTDFPQTGDGQDPIITQTANRPFSLPGHGQLTSPPWVTTTGGDYFFAPSRTAIQQLASGSGA
jgi:Dyp-type peroxidase family